MLSKKTYVRPEGILESAKILIVGEQPGRWEVIENRPITGQSGQELDTCLNAIGLVRSNCYITNIIKDFDHPFEFYFKEIKKGQKIIGYQPSDEAQEYLTLLKNELSKSPCKAVLAVGNLALFALTSRLGITKWRGSILESTLVPDKFIIPSLHPSTVIRGQFMNRRLIQFDMLKAKRISENGFKPEEIKLIIEPSYEDVCEFLTKIESSFNLLTFDLEVYNEEVSCISLAINSTEVMSIPFVSAAGDYFNPEQELSIWLRLAKILEEPERKLLGQNLTFDSAFLFRRYGIKIPLWPDKIHDTMIAQKITMPDYPKGLDFITSIHTDYPYYKEEGKKWFRTGGPWQQLWQYNAMDSLVCACAFESQKKYITKQDNEKTYNRTRAIVGPLVYMMEHGIKVDIEGIKTKSAELENEIEETCEQLNTLAGQELNANSPKQLIEYFFKKLGYKIGRCDSTDEKVMKKLKIKGCEEAGLVLKIRHLVKLNSTYLAIEKFDLEPDGTYRIRCSYDPVGTRYSRLSSSENIFGSGTNLQNWPHAIQRFLMADNGYVAYSLDLSQAENRIVAYVGEVVKMIAAFENGTDVHSLTASSIFSNSTIAQIIEEDKKEIPCALGDGKHTKRFWGKKGNHSSNYDIGKNELALNLEITATQAALILDSYFKLYPEVRTKYHTMVRQNLMYNKTLTNLMGRNTVFLGKICDELFKEAYACIPQGSVGDIINERGLNLVYYSNWFKPVELLAQTHDEIVFQIPLNLGWPEHVRLVSLIKYYLETPLKLINGKTFIIPADITMMRRFKVGRKVKILTQDCFQETYNKLEA